MNVELKSDPKLLPDVREQLRAWTAARGWSEQQIGEIVLAVDEALSNVIRHGYGGPCSERILLNVATRGEGADETLEIEIRDFTRRVDLSKICGRDLDDVKPGGLGVHLIRAMMESAEYSHAPGGGMRLVMRKRKSHTASSDASTKPNQPGPP